MYLGLPNDTLNNIVYAASRLAPVFDQEHVGSFVSAEWTDMTPCFKPDSSSFRKSNPQDVVYRCKTKLLTPGRDAIRNVSQTPRILIICYMYALPAGWAIAQLFLVLSATFVHSPSSLPQNEQLSVWNDIGFSYKTEVGSTTSVVGPELHDHLSP